MKSGRYASAYCRVVDVTANLIEEATFTAEVVPSRVAYLIAGKSREGIFAAIEEACTRWGGATEPILAVSSTGRITPWDRQLTELLRIDAVVNVDANPEAALRVAESFAKPLVELRHIDRAAPSRFSTFPGSFVRGAGHSVWLPSDDTVWQSVALGRLSPAASESLQQCGIGTSRSHGDDWGGRAQLSGRTLAGLTMSQFWQSRASNVLEPAPTVMWVASPNDVNDCRGYWNVRALRSLLGEPHPMLLIPSRGVEHWVDFDKNLAGVLARPADVVPDVVVVSNRVPLGRLRELGESLGLVPHKGKFTSTRRFPPPPPRQPPYSFAAGVDPRHWVAFERRYGATTQARANVFPHGATIDFEPPIEGGSGGLTLLRISSPVINRYPQREAVASALLDNASWRDGALEIGTHVQPKLQFTIRQPPMREILDLVLNRSGVTWRQSDKAAIVRLVTQRLSVARLLDPVAYGVVSALTTPRSKAVVQALESKALAGASHDELIDFIGSIIGRGAQVAKSFDELKQQLPNLAEGTLAELAAARWIERGLRTRCKDCGLTNFISLADTTPAGTCPTCGNECGYMTSGKDAALAYRLDGVVDRASDQGALPQAMAAYAAGRNDPYSFVVAGAALTFSDGRVGDADVLGIAHGQLIVGEVKTFANQFTSAEIIKDADRAQAAGADALLIGCPEWLPDSVHQLVAREAKRRKLEVLMHDGLASPPRR